MVEAAVSRHAGEPQVRDRRPGNGSPRGPRRGVRAVLVAAALVVAVGLAAFVTPAVAPGVLAGPRGHLAWFPPPGCPSTALDVAVAPVAAAAVTEAVAALQGS